PFFSRLASPPPSPLFPYTTLFRSARSRVSAEGMTTYADLVDATLARGVMPCVVPQLKSITVGGAAAGVGIEASSFRYGLVNDTLDRKSTRLNSSHRTISYAVFCLK